MAKYNFNADIYFAKFFMHKDAVATPLNHAMRWDHIDVTN